MSRLGWNSKHHTPRCYPFRQSTILAITSTDALSPSPQHPPIPDRRALLRHRLSIPPLVRRIRHRLRRPLLQPSLHSPPRQPLPARGQPRRPPRPPRPPHRPDPRHLRPRPARSRGGKVRFDDRGQRGGPREGVRGRGRVEEESRAQGVRLARDWAWQGPGREQAPAVCGGPW